MEYLKSRGAGTRLGVSRNTELPTVAEHLDSLNGNSKPRISLSSGIQKASPYIAIAGEAATSGIDADNTDYNLVFGSQSDTAKGIKAGVGSAIPIFGLANAAGNIAQSALNKGNRYNEFGYNEREGYGERYMHAGGLFDPAGMAMRSLEQGGEGSGARALLALTGVGGAAQFKYEQERGLEREQEQKMIDDSKWELNQFSFRPNLDV
jgi:hypothetical protein